MATEEQLDVGIHWTSVSDNSSHGQRLTISNRTVSKLSIYFSREGSPGGVTTLLIRRVSDDNIVATKLWGNSNDVPTAPDWHEVIFDSPVYINEEVRLLVTATTGRSSNLIQVYLTTADAKGGEYGVHRHLDGSYSSYDPKDTPYIYTYTEGVAVEARGDFGVKGTRLHYIDNSDAERWFLGSVTGNTGTAGKIKVKGTKFVYIDDDGDERDIEGTLTGNTVAAGDIRAKGTQFRYGGYDTDQRYIEGTLV